MDLGDLAFAGAAEQARLLAAGTITAPVLLDLYLERIARLDPQLRSYRTVLVQSARQEAAAAQHRLDAGERSPLLGVPIAIKDDVDVDGEVTTCGSAAVSTAAVRDAEVVSRLRAAGSVIIGKTNVPELMIFPFTESLTFGATRNPWNTALSPGGSSGGSAAAVAAPTMPAPMTTASADGGSASFRIALRSGSRPGTGRPGRAGSDPSRSARPARARSAPRRENRRLWSCPPAAR